MAENNETKVKSLYKALKILEYFDEEHKSAGVTELAEYSGMYKSSVHNILQTFEECGFVVQDSETSRYMLGGEIVSLFGKYKSTRKIDYRITEYLQAIRNEYQVDAYLAELDRDRIIYLCAEKWNHSKDSLFSKEGKSAPIHATAAGKILIGYSLDDDREQYYTNELEKYTKNTITDINKLKKEISTAVYKGYALCNAEYHNDIYALAVPVITGVDAVKYALGVSKQDKFSPYIKKLLLSDLTYTAKKIGSILME